MTTTVQRVQALVRCDLCRDALPVQGELGPDGHVRWPVTTECSLRMWSRAHYGPFLVELEV